MGNCCRHSSGLLSIRGGNVFTQSYTNGVDNFGLDEPDQQSWDQLLGSIPAEEKKTALIRRQHLVVSIPVCVVGKEHPVTFTSIDVIQQTLSRFYPEVVLRKQDVTCDVIDRHSTCDVNGISSRRKMSINTCISSMKADKTDYNKQLRGVHRVGSFAEDETLKVLFAKSDAISCILEAMKTFPDDEDLQKSACCSLLKMASASESNCVHIIQNDGVGVLTSTFRHHMEAADVIRPLVKSLSYISTSVDLSASLIARGLHSDVLTAMSRHASDREIVRDSCYIIGNLLITVEIAQQLMLIGGVHTILNMMEKYSDDLAILANSCRSLGSFAIYDETCLDVALAGSTAAVLKAMTSQVANATVLESGMWALATLTASETTCLELVKTDGVEIVLRTLTGYPRVEHVQEYGTRVLCNLSMRDSTVTSVSNIRVLSALHNVLLHFPENVELLEVAILTVSSVVVGLGCHSEKTMKAAADVIGIRDVVKVMTDLLDNATIQEHGCKILGNMAVEDELRKQIEDGGASRAIVASMLTLNTNADVQEVGCLALMNLTADNKDNKIRIKNTGAVSTITSALKEFSQHAPVVLSALKALGNLVSVEEACYQMLDEKILQLLGALVRRHRQEREVLTYAAIVLCGISELSNLEHQDVALIDHTLMVIWSAVKDDPEILLHVCQSFENLLRHDVGRKLFIEGKKMVKILEAMQTFTDNSYIHCACCKIIAVASLAIESKESVANATTLHSVLKSMELFPLDLTLQIVGCGAMSCMLEQNHELRETFIKLGAVAHLKRSLTTHTSDPGLAVLAIMALGHVLPLDLKTSAIEAKLAFDIILHGIKTFPENKEIQLIGCKALSRCPISDAADVLELVKSLTFVARRFGKDPNLKSTIGQVLLPFCQQSQVSDELQTALHALGFNTNEGH